MNEQLKRNNLLAGFTLCVGVALWGGICLMTLGDHSRSLAAGNVLTTNAKAGAGNVIVARFVKFSSAGVIVEANAKADRIIGVCELTADANDLTRYAPPGTETVIEANGTAITGGTFLACDANGKGYPTSKGRAAAIALSSDATGTATVRAIVWPQYVADPNGN